MVESTSPLSPFMSRDWCTPDLAAEFVRIAFDDGAWALIDAFDKTPDLVCELTNRLALHFPLIANEDFEYATANRLFDQLVEKLQYSHNNLRNSYYCVPTVLKMFIAGLPSSKPDSQIFRNFLGYLHGPDVLFSVCAFLVGAGFSKAFHDLAWPVCLQRLREYVCRPAEQPDWCNIPGVLADLTTFLEGDDVKSLGRTPPYPIVPQVNVRPVNSPKDTWRNARRRVQRYIAHDASHEDMALSNIGAV